MTRRLILFGLLTVSLFGTGCFHLRERIAWRWSHFHGCGAACPAPCAPPCATPAFRIPSPPVRYGPVLAAPVEGCSSCAPGGPVGPLAVGAPVAFASPIVTPGVPAYAGGPVISPPVPLLPNPRVVPDPMTPPKN